MKIIQQLLFTTLLFLSTHCLFAQCQCTANDAVEYIGEYCEVTGTIVDTYQTRGNQTVFLHFEKGFPNQVFKVVVFSNYLQFFKKHPLEYEGKKVTVKGQIGLFRGDVQMILNSEDGIEVVE